MNTNSVTKSILELIATHENGKYNFHIKDKVVPVLLNKDKTTTYPEIRVTPFIEKHLLEHQKYIEDTYKEYRDWGSAVFQVDIFSKKIIEAHNIYDVLMDRLYDFFNLETVIYNYNNDFEEISPNVYKNIAYAIEPDSKKALFKNIYGVEVKNKKLTRVNSLDEIIPNSYYVNEEALYINTDCIECIKIKALMQGRLFENGDSYSDRGIHYYEVSKQKNLSSLEDNEVERISFDMYFIYSHKREREQLPNIKRVTYGKKHYVR